MNNCTNFTVKNRRIISFTIKKIVHKWEIIKKSEQNALL